MDTKHYNTSTKDGSRPEEVVGEFTVHGVKFFLATLGHYKEQGIDAVGLFEFRSGEMIDDPFEPDIVNHIDELRQTIEESMTAEELQRVSACNLTTPTLNEDIPATAAEDTSSPEDPTGRMSDSDGPWHGTDLTHEGPGPVSITP